tara:strand:- start:5487 stop:5711 length:225 start_codon:yes stop_codon:yes gene_type:complete
LSLNHFTLSECIINKGSYQLLLNKSAINVVKLQQTRPLNIFYTLKYFVITLFSNVLLIYLKIITFLKILFLVVF